jgi:hypothetical protein
MARDCECDRKHKRQGSRLLFWSAITGVALIVGIISNVFSSWDHARAIYGWIVHQTTLERKALPTICSAAQRRVRNPDSQEMGSLKICSMAFWGSHHE